MGWSVSWLAVKNKPASEIFEHFGLKSAGEHCDCFETPISFRAQPNGWGLLALNHCEHEFLSPQHMKALSLGGELISCTADEHVMFSAAEDWRDGARIWRVVHNCEEEIEEFKEVETFGSPPAALDEILGSLRKQQNEADEDARAHADALSRKKLGFMMVDYFFDAPIRLAESQTGFAHDQSLPDAAEGSSAKWDVLVSIPTKRRWLHW